MKKIPVIGLMSGTSMDGINGTVVFTDGNTLKRTGFNMIEPYGTETKHLLQKAIIKKKSNSELDRLITNDHFKVIKKLIDISKIIPHLIGFHGQTIYHSAKNKISIQAGNSNILCNLTKTNIISNFRKKDIELGGQGAPISPIYHKYLALSSKLPLPCCFLNIGGVANITYIDENELIGFDTGPGNGLMDLYVQHHLKIPFDFSGKISSTGKINTKIINVFFQNNFFKKSFPKTLDRKQFNNIFKMDEFRVLSVENALATLCEITSLSIKKSIDLLPELPKILIVTGGGTKNLNLMKRLINLMPFTVIKSDQINLNSEFIEAEMIAYLAARSTKNLPITFPSTTGIKQSFSAGDITKFINNKTL